MSSDETRRTRVSLSLRVHGVDLDCEVINELLGCDATHFHKAGDARVGGGGRQYAPYSCDLWTFEISRASDSLATELEVFVRTISADRFARLYGRQYTADLFVGIFVGDDGVATACLSRDVMEQLAARGLTIQVSIYA